jgi:protein-tyrosine-phosphatase
MTLRAALRRILPAWVGEAVDDWHVLGSHARVTYLRLRTARWLGLRRDAPQVKPSVRHVLFVCHGNIIRSAFAEHLARRRMTEAGRDDVVLESAGLHAKPGRPADPRACSVAATYGVSLEAHVSRSVTPAQVSSADLIVVMDHRNEAEIVAEFKTAPRSVLLLGGVLPGPERSSPIRDPYTGDVSDVEACFRTIDAATSQLVSRLIAR